MKTLIKTVVATSIATPTMLLGLSSSAFGIDVITENDTEVKITVNNQTTSSSLVGEIPPINTDTNLPIEMTAAPLEVPNTEYIVQSGDNLSKIAAEFNLDVETLIKWNNLVSDTILIGQSLSVNGQVEPTAEQVAALEAAQRARTRIQVQQSQNNSQKNVQFTNVPAESAPSVDISNLIAIAHQYLGAPYVYGGTTPSGFDCSGYVSYVFKQAGKLSFNYSTVSLYNLAQKVSTPQVGDLVFFSGTYRAGISHVGIYIGNNLMINAAGNRVQINNIYDSYWGKHFTGFGRL